MRIAFTTKGNNWDSEMDPRFGRTEFILVYDNVSDHLSHYDNRDIENEAHGAGPKTAQKIHDLKVDVLITGNGPGGNAASVLEKSGIEVLTGAGELTARQAFDSYKKKALKVL